MSKGNRDLRHHAKQYLNDNQPARHGKIFMTNTIYQNQYFKNFLQFLDSVRQVYSVNNRKNQFSPIQTFCWTTSSAFIRNWGSYWNIVNIFCQKWRSIHKTRGSRLSSNKWMNALQSSKLILVRGDQQFTSSKDFSLPTQIFGQNLCVEWNRNVWWNKI